MSPDRHLLFHAAIRRREALLAEEPPPGTTEYSAWHGRYRAASLEIERAGTPEYRGYLQRHRETSHA